MENRKFRRLERRGGATLLTIGLALGGFGLFAPGAGAAQNNNDDPGGNQGVVKVVDATNPTVDTDVSNDPQVDCLGIKWFNFAEGATTTYTVTQVAPTDGGVAATWSGSLDDLGALNNDGADGSLDAFTTPTLTLTGEPKANGWHVNVHVETTASNGSVTKDKTVWVADDCAPDEGGENPQTASATIQVSKTVTGNNQPANPGSFSFSVACTTGTVTGSPVSVASGGSSTASVSWDASGTAPSCTVTETDAKGATSTSWAVTGGQSGNGTAASTGALTDGGTAQVAFTNDYTRQGGGGGCTENCGPVVIDIPTTTVPAPTTTVPAPTTTVAPPTTAPAQVAGEVIVNTPAPAVAAPQSQVLGTQLARTGAMTDRLILAAGLCLLLGGIALVASKERTVPTRRR